MHYANNINLSYILHRAMKCNDPKLFGHALFEL